MTRSHTPRSGSPTLLTLPPTNHPVCIHAKEFADLREGTGAAIWACAQGIQFITDPLFLLMAEGIEPLRWFDDVLPEWAQATWRRLHQDCASTPWAEQLS